MVYVLIKTKAIYKRSLHDKSRFKAVGTGDYKELKSYKTLNGVLKAFKRLGDPKPLKDIINENNTSGFVYSIITSWRFGENYDTSDLNNALGENFYIKA